MKTIFYKMLTVSAITGLVIAAGCTASASSIGIIGGADGPTAIFVASNKVSASLAKTLDKQARLLLGKIEKLSSNKEYVKLMTGSPELSDAMVKIAKINYTKPLKVFQIDNLDNAAQQLIIKQNDGELDKEILNIAADKVTSSLASQAGATNGVEFLAASTCLSVSENFVGESGAGGSALMYTYTDGYCVLVTFLQNDAGIITATANVSKSDVLPNNPKITDVEKFFAQTIDTQNITIELYK